MELPKYWKPLSTLSGKEVLQGVGAQECRRSNFSLPRKYLSKYCWTVVRWKSNADLHVVLVDLPGEIVEHLVIAVEAVARDAAGCAELSETADENDRHPGIEWRRTTAKRSLVAAHKPIELGWKFWSAGKNPSAKRFHP